MEVVGVVLGAIPLIISAMEYYPKVKELGKQTWQFRRMHGDECRRVLLCKQLLESHLQTLLGMNDADFEEVLRDPANKIWKDTEVGGKIKQRLGRRYEAYAGMIAIVEEEMAQMMKAAKVDDEGFKQYLASTVAKPSDAADLKVQATAFFRKVTTKARIGKHAFGHRERKSLLERLETDIRGLKELLDAADGVKEANKNQQIDKNYHIPAAMQGFWSRAERVWRLINEHLRCACKSKHCARLWFDHSSMAQHSLGLVLLFDKAFPRTSEPWKRHLIKVHLFDQQCPCGYQLGRPKPSDQSPAASPPVTIQVSDPAGHTSPEQGLSRPNLTPTSISRSSSLLDRDLCEILKHHDKEHVCLGALFSKDDGHPYHFMPNKDKAAYDFVPLSAMLDRSSALFFELNPRKQLAAMLAHAHLRFYRTPWIPARWRLEDVCFPRDAQDPNKVQFDMPYILADLVDTALGNPQPNSSMNQGFVTLAILLLELCFGRALETHQMWIDAGTSMNKADPCHRQCVAIEWAKKIDLMIDGPEYSKAVKWCLFESPVDEGDARWRDEFAMNVLGPLLKCANMLS